MIDFDSSIARRTKAAEALWWAGAALVALGAHAGAAYWLLDRGPEVAVDTSPPPAIMLEVAAEPEATRAEAVEIAPDLTPADESAAAAERQPEETPRERVAEAVTEPGATMPVEDQTPREKAAVLEKAAVPLPPPRARPPRRVEPARDAKPAPRSKPRRPQPHPQRASRPQRAAQQAQVLARPSDRMAAEQTATGASSHAPADWQSQLMAHLERRKRYPAAARERGARGTAYARFTIDAAGRVLSAGLVRSSGFDDLDQEVVSLIHRASPVPPPPPGAHRSITVPVRFSAD